MPIKYNVYETPSPDGGGKNTVHARVVNTGLVTTSRLAKEIEFSTSLTGGDVVAVLSSLSWLMIENLLNGKRIHLEGVGYFQLSIKGPSAGNAKDIRAQHIKVKTIKFRPEKSVIDKLSQAEFKRVRASGPSKRLSKEDMHAALDDYFQDHTHITRAEFQQLFYLARTTSINRINELLKEGILVNEGTRHHPVYKWKGGESDEWQVEN